MKQTKSKINYIERDRILYPAIAIPEHTDYPIGKYGFMRLDFLKKYRRGTYTTLLVTFKLNEHLAEIDQEARSQVEYLTAELAKKRGIDENIKASNPLLWVQEMNNCKTSAEEVVLREVVNY